MAQAFRPSRSAIYGAPDREALVGVGNTLLGQLQDWSNEEIQADYIQQMTAGSVALARERHALFSKMTTEKAKTPGEWVSVLQQNKQRIETAALAGIRQPRAKQAMQAKIQQELAQWEFDLDNAAKKQMGDNAANAFVATYQSKMTESRDYSGPMGADEMMADIRDVLEFVTENENPAGLPTHPNVATPEAADFLRRKMVRHIANSYALQQALASGDESLLDQVNEIGHGVFAGGEPLNGPEEQGELKKRYKDTANTAKAEVKAEKEARANAFDRAATDAILAGKYTFQNDQGETVSWLDAIIANQDLEPGTKRTLEEKYRARVNSQNKTKLYDDTKMAQARIEVLSETDRKKQFDLLFNHAAGLGEKETESLRELIFDPERNFSQVASDLNAKMTAIQKVRTQGSTDPKEKDAIQNKLRWLHDQLLRQLEANTDWTTKQQKEVVEAGLDIVRDEAGKEQVKGIKALIQNLGASVAAGAPVAPTSMGGYGWAPKGKEPAPKAKVRMIRPDGIIGRIDPDEVAEAIKQGWRRAD